MSSFLRIEKGDHGVSIEIYAAVLNSLGLLNGLVNIAGPVNDDVGMEIANANLPRRIRAKQANLMRAQKF